MFEKIWNIIERILPVIVIILLVSSFITSCNERSRLNEQLTTINNYIDTLGESVHTLNEGLGRQESAIAELTSCQSRLEQSIDGITDTVTESARILGQLSSIESGVDGDAGAIYASLQQLESILSTTLAGIEAEGIQ